MQLFWLRFQEVMLWLVVGLVYESNSSCRQRRHAGHHQHHHQQQQLNQHHHCHNIYLGCADFVPSNLDPGSQFAVPMFECFDEVLRKAASWVRHQRRVRITNVQSIDYKLKHDYGIVSYVDVLNLCRIRLYLRTIFSRSSLVCNKQCQVMRRNLQFTYE